MVFDARRIAMQYSPHAIMYVSMVDAGTVEFSGVSANNRQLRRPGQPVRSGAERGADCQPQPFAGRIDNILAEALA